MRPRTAVGKMGMGCPDVPTRTCIMGRSPCRATSRSNRHARNASSPRGRNNYQFAGPEQGSAWISTNLQQSSPMMDDGSQPGTGPCAVNRFQPCMSGSSRGPRATHEDNESTTEVPPPNTAESDVRETYHDLNLRRRNVCA
jgi:hypothetical protein